MRRSRHRTGVTIHFVNDNFELKHYLLETKEFPESHSAANIAEELKSILSEWGLVETSIFAITTDNGRNISAAARELGWVNLPCFSHTLQLSVENILRLRQIAKAISRCKINSDTLSPFQQVILHLERAETKSSWAQRIVSYSRSFRALELFLLHGSAYPTAATTLMCCTSRGSQDRSNAN